MNLEAPFYCSGKAMNAGAKMCELNSFSASPRNGVSVGATFQVAMRPIRPPAGFVTPGKDTPCGAFAI